MPQSRTKVDPAAAAGVGFPFVLLLSVLGAFVATQSPDVVILPREMAVEKTGFAFVATHAQVKAQSPGDRTTGSYALTLTKTDRQGNAIGTLGTFTIPASGALTFLDLRDAAKRGVGLKPGEGIRLDTGAAATGGATNASNLIVRVFGETFGIEA